MTSSSRETKEEHRSIKSEIFSIFRPGSAQKTLWLTTLAFFLTFVVWFDMAPFTLTIARNFRLDKTQVAALLLCNLVLAVPGRVLAGRLLDRYGPRRLFGYLLMVMAIPNTFFAFSHTFVGLAISRLLVGLIGSGFVIGIRLVAEWYQQDQIGVAEGVYGGWGNFGSAAAALVLPTLGSLMIFGANGWRWAIFTSGLISAIYGAIFLRVIKDAPDGKMFKKARSASSLEVSSKLGVVGLLVIQIPMVTILGIVVNRLYSGHILSYAESATAYLGLAVLFIYQSYTAIALNKKLLQGSVPKGPSYKFRSVFLLSLSYAVTFGTELTMVSLLPTYFASAFGLKVAAAGMAGSAFAFTNLVTRPGGGIISDVSKSRTKVLALLLFGTAVIFLIMSRLTSQWPLPVGIAVVALSSIFIQGSNGAAFAIVPTVRKDITGQIAGIVGAYGNIGGLALASLLYYTSTKTSIGNVTLMFEVIAAAAALVAILCKILLPDQDRNTHLFARSDNSDSGTHQQLSMSEYPVAD